MDACRKSGGGLMLGLLHSGVMASRPSNNILYQIYSSMYFDLKLSFRLSKSWICQLMPVTKYLFYIYDLTSNGCFEVNISSI